MSNESGVSEVSFWAPNTSTPADEVDNAISRGCDTVWACIAGGIEEVTIMKILSTPNRERRRVGRSVPRPTAHLATETYFIVGQVLETKQRDGSKLLTTVSVKNFSHAPGVDVRDALSSGSTVVFVGHNPMLSANEVFEKREKLSSKMEADLTASRMSGETFARDHPIPTYCPFERRITNLTRPLSLTLDNGLTAITGSCSSCGKPLSRLGRLR